MNASAPPIPTPPIVPVRRLAALAFGVTLSLFAASAARSQDMLNSAGAGSRANQAATSQHTPTVKPADAIPGAAARAPAAPASKTVGDLQPNDALFDAINRGDIAAARDALNRGADLGATNVLGMTPMELSVDLSRNDITFLLLSMRGDDSDRGSLAVGRGSRPSGKIELSGKPTAPRKAAAARTLTAKGAPAAVRPAPTPRRFANDGGTPLPSAGFLGFGSGPAAN